MPAVPHSLHAGKRWSRTTRGLDRSFENVRGRRAVFCPHSVKSSRLAGGSRERARSRFDLCRWLRRHAGTARAGRAGTAGSCAVQRRCPRCQRRLRRVACSVSPASQATSALPARGLWCAVPDPSRAASGRTAAASPDAETAANGETVPCLALAGSLPHVAAARSTAAVLPRHLGCSVTRMFDAERWPLRRRLSRRPRG
jgi:hypothetical protein